MAPRSTWCCVICNDEEGREDMNGNREILLVEDNPDDVELTRIAFAEAGSEHRLTVVSDGAEALDFLFARGAHVGRASADLPAVVLLDLNLPKVNGREVLLAIRAHHAPRRVPVPPCWATASPPTCSRWRCPCHRATRGWACWSSSVA